MAIPWIQKLANDPPFQLASADWHEYPHQPPPAHWHECQQELSVTNWRGALRQLPNNLHIKHHSWYSRRSEERRTWTSLQQDALQFARSHRGVSLRYQSTGSEYAMVDGSYGTDQTCMLRSAHLTLGVKPGVFIKSKTNRMRSCEHKIETYEQTETAQKTLNNWQECHIVRLQELGRSVVGRYSPRKNTIRLIYRSIESQSTSHHTSQVPTLRPADAHYPVVMFIMPIITWQSSNNAHIIWTFAMGKECPGSLLPFQLTHRDDSKASFQI